MLEMLEQFELSVCTLGQYWSAEGLHDILNSDILVGELIAGGAAEFESARCVGDKSRRRCRRTKRVQKLPCQQAAGRSIYFNTSQWLKNRFAGDVEAFQPVAECHQPGSDLECRSKNLCAHEFGHDDGLGEKWFWRFMR